MALSKDFNVTGIYAADIDGDGDMDVLGTAEIADDITWWENDGEQDFTEHTIAPDFHHAISVYAADVDGDDDMDVLGAAINTDSIAWWENDGNENFTEHLLDGYFNGARSVHAADINGDGYMDVLGAACGADAITWWENDGAQDFTEHTIADTFDYAMSVYAIDVDGDSDMDVLGAAYYAHDITWWENDGAQDFTEHTIASNFINANSVYAADIDNDGDIDVLGSGYSGIDLWENNGEQEFTGYIIDSSSAYDVYAVDIDNDGDIDILGMAWTGNEITWWENLITHPGQFELVSPADGSTIDNDSVTVTWTTSVCEDSIGYIIEWSLFEGFPEDSTIIESTNDTFFVITEVPELDELPDDITIYWRVKAVNENIFPRWANENDEGWSFDIYISEPPNPFALLYPPDGFEITNQNDFPLTFRWERAVDPDPGDELIYVFELSTDEAFIEGSRVIGAMDSVSIDNIDNDRYWWRVSAFDSYDLCTTSEVRSLTVALGVGESGSIDIPSEFAIVSAYPNPFNPSLSLVIGIPEPSELSIQIINILGEEVALFANGFYKPGYHKFQFNAANITSGIYFIHASVQGKAAKIRKVVLIR